MKFKLIVASIFSLHSMGLYAGKLEWSLDDVHNHPAYPALAEFYSTLDDSNFPQLGTYHPKHRVLFLMELERKLIITTEETKAGQVKRPEGFVKHQICNIEVVDQTSDQQRLRVTTDVTSGRYNGTRTSYGSVLVKHKDEKWIIQNIEIYYEPKIMSFELYDPESGCLTN